MKKAFTLIEIMIVIVVIGIMGTISTMGLSGIFGKDLNDYAREISSNISFLFDKALSSNAYVRIEFNFKENSYKVSSSRDRVLLFGKKLKVFSGEIERDEKEIKREETIKEEKKNSESSFSSFMENNENIVTINRFKQAQFSSISNDEDLNFNIEFSNTVRLYAVYTEHYEDYVKKGKASIFIFPNNFIQESVIVLEDIIEQRFISIIIEPYTGEASIEDGIYELSNLNQEIEEDE